jgi:hypothetical protein
MDGTRQLKEATMEDAALNLARKVLNESEGTLPYEDAIRTLAQGVIDREEALAPEGPSDPS